MKKLYFYLLPVLLISAGFFFTFNEAKTAPGLKPAVTCEQNICTVNSSGGVQGCKITVYPVGSSTPVADCTTGPNGCCTVTLDSGTQYQVITDCNPAGARVIFTACTLNRLIINVP